MDDPNSSVQVMEDQHWMQIAISQAKLAEQAGEVPVGSVLVRNKQLLATGFNQPISATDPTAHAEIVAIRSAAVIENNYRLPDTSLYVTIEPCTMCVGAMMHARIREVVFGAKEPRSGALCSQHQLGQHPGFNHQLIVRSGVLEAECSALMTEFFLRKRKHQP